MGSAPSFAIVTAGWAGLSDDLGSLRDDRDGDRSKQGEGGGDTGNLGHVNFPRVSVSVDYEMPRAARLDAMRWIFSSMHLRSAAAANVQTKSAEQKRRAL
ncbi:hypothetical protein ATE48_06000 [Candidatus Viadribacter manganicus]|uniref:Uncharacterized protein n=1 Tax=Candidatus Viadribacter manganicus TaxID=1759059 RepID=A0A1B1AG13_9PROT|nr:hypothetical protein ATE48_06000 [Candidatus Viadribacter manganicus]